MTTWTKWHCRYCFRDCEDNGYGVHDTRICRDCADAFREELGSLLGIGIHSFSEMGLEIEWPEAVQLATNITYHPGLRAAILTDRARYEMV